MRTIEGTNVLILNRDDLFNKDIKSQDARLTDFTFEIREAVKKAHFVHFEKLVLKSRY